MAQLNFQPENQINPSDLDVAKHLNSTLVTGVSDVQETGDRAFFAVEVGGIFDKSTLRTMWGNVTENGIRWERFSQDQAIALMKAQVNIESKMSVESHDIQPREFEGSNGQTQVARTRRVVRFADETARQALAAYGEQALEVASSIEADVDPVISEA